MFDNPKKFFVRQLLLLMITFIMIVVIVALTSGGNTGIIIGAVLAAVNAFFIFFMFMISINYFIKSLRTKDDVNRGMHVLNFVLSLLFSVGYFIFYMAVVAISFLPLISFL